MRKALLTTLLFFAVASISMAQTWQKFNYQGVARDATNEVLDNQAISVRVTVHSGTAAGPDVYQETHAVTTNEFGLFDLVLGGGAVVSGTFGSIGWGADDFFVEVEMDPAGGVAYADMGTSQLLAVPYALYAENAGTPGTPGPTGATGPVGATGATGPLVAGTADQTLRNNGSTWVAASNLVNDGDFVGIGTATPATTVHMVHGNGTGTNGLTIENSGSSYWSLYAASTDDFWMNSAGSHVGTFDDVSGTYSTVSDKRMKRNITHLSSSLNKVMSLHPSSYEYISGDDGKRYNGFIAQELLEVIPEAVTQQANDGAGVEDLLMVSYNDIIPVLTGAIQEQQVLIEQLQKEIELLKNK